MRQLVQGVEPELPRFWWTRTKEAVDEVVQAFKQKYESARRGGLLPDAIFTDLQAFAGGLPPVAPPRQAAAGN